MHVLYFHQYFTTPKGSSGTRSYEMAQALLRSGHQVTMVCGSVSGGNTGLDHAFKRSKRRGVVDGINVIEIELSYGNHLGIVQRLLVFTKFAFLSIMIALREPCDAVFATSTPLTAGIPGIFARWLRRKPFVFEVRDLWPELPKAMGVISNPIALWLMSILEWVSYRSADRLVGLSPGIVRGIKARGVRKDRVAMIPNGCDLGLFENSDQPWRPSGVRDDQLLAIFTGTHGQANGLDAVLEAAPLVAAGVGDGVCIALVGQGREKARLVKRAKEENIGNVIFLDPVPKTKLTGLMAGADIGLQILRNVPAFYYGTSPNKFFDYIAAGLPVINNYPGWLAELVTNNECGFAVSPDDPQEFADALVAASKDRQGLQQKGQNARLLAQESFARSALSSQWVDWVEGAYAPKDRSVQLKQAKEIK